jgi:hypothetical protein
MSEPVVKIEHIRQARLCARGAREWFALHGLDYSVFLQHGYPASVIEGTGDALGCKVAAIARSAVSESAHG